MAVVLKVSLILARVCVFSDVFVLLVKLFSFMYLHPCSEGKVSRRILSLITLMKPQYCLLVKYEA